MQLFSLFRLLLSLIMVASIEQIGQSVSWPRRIRKFFGELFGSRLVERLERELLQVRLDKDKQITELTKERDTLLNAVLQTKGITVRQPINAPTMTGIPKPITGPTTWQTLQAQAMEENAKAEAAEKSKES